MRQISLAALGEGSDCPTCKRGEYEYLAGRRGSHTAVLCGRNAVQLSFPGHAALDLAELARKLVGMGQVTQNKFLLRFTVGEHTLTVFPDGRAIIGGTADIAEARTLYARYIGS